jgi:hypothetical protein
MYQVLSKSFGVAGSHVKLPRNELKQTRGVPEGLRVY